jgi:hypothetical protein
VRAPESGGRGSKRRDRRLQSGQSFVEFILVIPILMAIALAVGDFGRVYATGIAVEDAAREAADYAAFDDLAASHFFETAGVVDANDATRLEALRRACAAVSNLPGYQSGVANYCTDPTSRCQAAAGSFCQLVVEDRSGSQPYLSTCDPTDPVQNDFTCGWVVHVTVTWDFHTIINAPPLPSTVSFVQESYFAISALPGGTPPGP